MLFISFVLGLLSFLCFSFSSAVSTAWSALSRLFLCFLFSAVVCGVLRGSLQEHDGGTSMTSEVSLSEHDGFNYVEFENVAPLNRIYSFYSRLLLACTCL